MFSLETAGKYETSTKKAKGGKPGGKVMPRGPTRSRYRSQTKGGKEYWNLGVGARSVRWHGKEIWEDGM